jgi:hypothetical protein
VLGGDEGGLGCSNLQAMPNLADTPSVEDLTNLWCGASTDDVNMSDTPMPSISTWFFTPPLHIPRTNRASRKASTP